MDYDINIVEIVLSTALAVVIGIVGWLLNTVGVNGRQIATLQERTRNHGESLAELGKIHARIDEVAAGLANVVGQLSQANRSLGLINAHLMQHGESQP